MTDTTDKQAAKLQVSFTGGSKTISDYFNPPGGTVRRYRIDFLLLGSWEGEDKI